MCVFQDKNSQFTARTPSMMTEKVYFLLRSALVPFGRVAVFCRRLFPQDTKQLEREADHSSPFSANFIYTSPLL